MRFMPKPKPAHGKQERRPQSLGLAKFADAKTSTYDKQARKQKERALNSKVVNKYRKLQARLEQQDGGAAPQPAQATPQQLSATDAPAVSPTQSERNAGKQSGAQGKQRHKRPESRIQRIAREKAAEKAAEQRARQDERWGVEQRAAQRQQTAQQRREENALMRKKTRSGQPVMKFRIDKILGKLQSATS